MGDAVSTWKDATSYSRSEPHPRVPRSWRLDITRDFYIWVGSDHVYHRGTWVVTCPPFFEARPLRATTSKEAQAEALAMVNYRVVMLATALAALEAPHAD